MFCVICENIILTEEEALEVEKKKEEVLKKEEELNMRKQQEEREFQQRKKEIIHSPISPPLVQEERKRQKIEYTSFVTPVSESNDFISDQFSCKDVVSTLSTKMNELTERVKRSNDPRELSELFKSIKQCAGAIQACVEASQACDKL